jgi:hypothetical protein
VLGFQSAIKAELNKIRAERAESMGCACVPSLPPEHRKASITSLLNLAVEKKVALGLCVCCWVSHPRCGCVLGQVLPATDEAGNAMDKHKLLMCLFVNDEPLVTKSKADQRMVLCELLRESAPKLCSEDGGCLCAKGSYPPLCHHWFVIVWLLMGVGVCTLGQTAARVDPPALVPLRPVRIPWAQPSHPSPSMLSR